MLEDQKRAEYAHNVRTMATAATKANNQAFDQKTSKEAFLRREQADLDKTDLNRVNMSHLIASAALTQTGMK